MSDAQKARLYKRLKPFLVILTLGFVYYLWLRVTGIRIPCLFYTVTGYLCPGCGVTRMVMACLSFDFKLAFYYNGAILTLSPVILFLMGRDSYEYIRYGQATNPFWVKALIVLLGIVLLSYGIVRNI